MKQLLRILLVLVASMQLARAAAAGAWANQAQVSTAAQTNFLMLLVGNTGTTNDNALMSITNATALFGGVGASPSYPGAFVIDDSGPKWLTPRNYVVLYDDFFSGSGGAILGWNNTSTGTSATAGVNSVVDLGHFGVWRVDTGTTTTGKGVMSLGSVAKVMCFGQGRVVSEWLANLSNLSDDTDDFVYRIGFSDGYTTAAETPDGVYFRYNDNVNSGNYQCITANNSSYTTNNTSVAATASTTGGAWTRFTIDVDAAGANAIFYINGTSVATNSANIPITVARMTSPLVSMDKTAGTNARKVLIDYFWFFWKPTTPR